MGRRPLNSPRRQINSPRSQRRRNRDSCYLVLIQDFTKEAKKRRVVQSTVALGTLDESKPRQSPAHWQTYQYSRPVPPNLPPTHANVVRAQQARNSLWGKAQDIFRPVVQYHATRFIGEAKKPGDLVQTTKIMACGRLFNPSWVKLNDPAAVAYEELRCLTFVTSTEIGQIQLELSTMKVLCQELKQADARDFYRRNVDQLPTFAAVFRKLILVQPSSAMVERVFSMLENGIHDTQKSMLLAGWRFQL